MSLGNLVKLRHPGHGPVVVHDLAQDPGRIEPGQARQVHRPFGLASPLEDTTLVGPERKDMARTGEIGRLGLGVYCRLDGRGPVFGGDAGRDPPAGVD